MSTVAEAKTTALWLDQLDPRAPRAALDGDREVDVAIVGGGFSGLWTAYYLSELDPSIRVAVIEKEHCGFGAPAATAVGASASSPDLSRSTPGDPPPRSRCG